MGENQRIVFSNNLNRYMKSLDIDQTSIVNALGVSTSTVSDWVTGKKYPRVDTMQRLADFLGVLISDLTAERIPGFIPGNLRPISDLHRQRVPLIGDVAAGYPIYAPEEVGVYVDSPMDADAAITIRGDSMEPTYKDGDLVYIKCCPDVAEGTVAVVFLDDEATIKHVYKRPTGLTLIGDNRAYSPIMAEFEEYPNLRIFGVPVGYTRMYKPNITGKIKRGF